MARPICVVCGGPRIPIAGWPKVHPACLSGGTWVWTPQQMTEWLARREPQTPERPPSTATGGTGDRST